MNTSKSEENLSSDSDAHELHSNAAALEELNKTTPSSNHDSTASSIPDPESLSPGAARRKQSEAAILQLNEETNEWKIARQKRTQMKKGRSNLHSSIVKLQAYLKHENAIEFRFRCIVAFLLFSILILVLLTRYFHYHQAINKSILNQIYLHKSTRKITFIDRDGNNLLNLDYGMNIPSDIQPVNCLQISPSNILCLDWKYRSHLTVKSFREKYNNSLKFEDTITCYNFKWQSYEKYSSLKDCFEISDNYWFGMGDLYKLKWPLNKMSVAASPLITSHRETDDLSGSIIGRTWFLSKGVSISVPLNVPLFVSVNSTEDPNRVCFISKKQPPYHMNNLNSYYVHLEYSVCLAHNVSSLQNYMFETTLKGKNTRNRQLLQTSTAKPKNISSTDLVRFPENEYMFLDRIIWSTNVNVLPNFTQQTVQFYVDQITNYGLGGIILLDSRWENSIGEIRMNETAFNNPKVLVNILHNKGFKIMLTLSPNIALRSSLVYDASRYLMLDAYLQTPLLTRCITDYEHVCALINYTNPSNCDRFKINVEKELLSPQGLSVDGIFFRGIQSSLIPRYVNFDRSINPDLFLEYTNSVIKSLQTSVGISTSVNSHNFLGYATIYPRDSSWKALQSIIPSVLSLGLLGYPLVNSGSVGGVQLFTRVKNQTDYINKELYLRWLQLVIFLPVVQFEEPPGGNDLDVIKVAKRLLKLRSEHFLPAMKASLLEYYEKGSPIIRPMWWTQNENDAYQIGDQFFVGNNIIVAPIVEEGKTERDIYLPNGWWKDEILAQVIRGGKWMRKYQVPLDKVAFFVREGRSQES